MQQDGKSVEFVNTPMSERQLEALEFIRVKMGHGPDRKVKNVDIIRKALIELAISLGWQDPASAMPPAPPKGKSTR